MRYLNSILHQHRHHNGTVIGQVWRRSLQICLDRTQLSKLQQLLISHSWHKWNITYLQTTLFPSNYDKYLQTSKNSMGLPMCMLPPFLTIYALLWRPWPFNVILPKIAEPYTTHPNHFKLSIITQHSMVRILHKQRFLSIYGLVVTLAFELLTSESSVHFCPQVYEICKFGEISRPGVYKRSLSLNRWMIRCTDRQTNPKR